MVGCEPEIAAERAKCSEALSSIKLDCELFPPPRRALATVAMFSPHRHEGRVSALLAAASYVNFSRRRTPVSEDDHVPKYQNVT